MGTWRTVVEHCTAIRRLDEGTILICDADGETLAEVEWLADDWYGDEPLAPRVSDAALEAVRDEILGGAEFGVVGGVSWQVVGDDD